MLSSAPQPYLLRLRLPGYLLLGLALTLPFVDVLALVMPLHPGQLQWRFGAVGLVATTVAGPLLALFLIYVLGLAAGDRKVIILCCVLAALFAVVLAAGAGSFMLDALQMKRRIVASRAAQFQASSTQATIKLMAYSLASLVLAVSIFRTLRMARVVPGETVERPGSLLVGVRADRPRVPTNEVSESRVDSTGADSDETATLPPQPSRPVARGVRPPSVGSPIPPPPPRRTDES